MAGDLRSELQIVRTLRVVLLPKLDDNPVRPVGLPRADSPSSQANRSGRGFDLTARSSSADPVGSTQRLEPPPPPGIPLWS